MFKKIVTEDSRWGSFLLVCLLVALLTMVAGCGASPVVRGATTGALAGSLIGFGFTGEGTGAAAGGGVGLLGGAVAGMVCPSCFPVPKESAYAQGYGFRGGSCEEAFPNDEELRNLCRQGAAERARQMREDARWRARDYGYNMYGAPPPTYYYPY